MTASGIEQGGTGELWPNPHSGVVRMRVRMRMKLKHLLRVLGRCHCPRVDLRDRGGKQPLTSQGKIPQQNKILLPQEGDESSKDGEV